MRELAKRFYQHLGDTLFILKTAATLRDRWVIGRYVLQNGLAMLRKKRLAPAREWNVQFKDIRFVFKEFASELTGYLEIYGGKIYELVPSFVPQAGWTILDVGANLGMFTIRQSRRVGPAGRIYAFEPNREVGSRLQRNLRLNTVDNATLIQKAASQRTGTARFAVHPRSSCAGRIVQSAEAVGMDVVELETISLDDFTDEYRLNRIDLLKIDVEGTEIDVLRGAESTLRATKNLVLEYHSGELRRAVVEIVTALEFQVVHDHVQDRVLYCSNVALKDRP
jgi:FkbM family methyltransferase